jgi:Predicted hydrolase of the alpha/beta superfamily
MTFRPPKPEPVRLDGPAGVLEALLEEPADAVPGRFAVVCHPHPLHGGTMNNKVVHTLARTFNELGIRSLRFNFRGVGASEGSYAEGIGETEDALAVIEWGRVRWPGAEPLLAGFSFGGIVALRAAGRVRPQRLVTVAPAVTRLDVRDVRVPDCPWLIVQGDADEIIDARAVLDWAARLTPSPTVKVLPGVTHFFHGHLPELREAVMSFMKDLPDGA